MTYPIENIAPCRGENCNEKVFWGHLFGKRHPFDFVMEGNEPVAIGSHFSTCPDADKFRGGYLTQLKRDASIREMHIEKWNTENSKLNKPSNAIKWDQVNIVWTVNDKDALKVANMLCKRGGAFEGHDTRDVRSHIRATILNDDYILALVLKSAAFNFAHHHFHGFMMSVFEDMKDRKPVCVAGYQLEPYCAIPERYLT